MVLLRIAVFTFISVAVAVTAWFAYNAAKDSVCSTLRCLAGVEVKGVLFFLRDTLAGWQKCFDVPSHLYPA